MSDLEIEIARLRQLGLTERRPGGAEVIRCSVQFRRRPSGHSRAAWRRIIAGWEADIARVVSDAGGALVPGSFSLTGQLVEVLVPVDALAQVRDEIDARHGRIDIVRPVEFNR